MLWHFCRARKRVFESLDKTHVPGETEPAKSRVILTVEQAAQFMEASTDSNICTLNAKVVFGGLCCVCTAESAMLETLAILNVGCSTA